VHIAASRTDTRVENKRIAGTGYGRHAVRLAIDSQEGLCIATKEDTPCVFDAEGIVAIPLILHTSLKARDNAGHNGKVVAVSSQIA